MDKNDIKQVVVNLLHKGHTVKVKATGVSMIPTLWPQTSLVVESSQCSEIKVGDIVLFIKDNDSLIAHRVMQLSNDQMLTQGDSCILDDGWIKKNDVIGKVVRAEALFIKISTIWIGARLYAKLLMATSPLSHRTNNIIAKIYVFTMSTIRKLFK